MADPVVLITRFEQAQARAQASIDALTKKVDELAAAVEALKTPEIIVVEPAKKGNK